MPAHAGGNHALSVAHADDPCDPWPAHCTTWTYTPTSICLYAGIPDTCAAGVGCHVEPANECTPIIMQGSIWASCSYNKQPAGTSCQTAGVCTADGKCSESGWQHFLLLVVHCAVLFGLHLCSTFGCCSLLRLPWGDCLPIRCNLHRRQLRCPSR